MSSFQAINSAHIRFIPQRWITGPGQGRTDLSLNPATHPDIKHAIYVGGEEWIVTISMKDMLAALTHHPVRNNGLSFSPFTIDVVNKTVNGIRCRMNVTYMN